LVSYVFDKENSLKYYIIQFLLVTINLDRQKTILVFIFLFAYVFLIYIYSKRPTLVAVGTKILPSELLRKPANYILVVYVWADVDVQYLGNLHFFVEHGVRATHPVDYFFILQQVGDKPVNESHLPILPSNARYIQHENKCYDIGTMGWFLSQNITDTTKYKYFFIMNSSIRGPFFTPFIEHFGIQWYEIFIGRITNEIKLVGVTINCYLGPHVQSYLWATDRVGLAILTSNTSGPLKCHSDYVDAVYNGELAASRAILDANYQIASLQSKYQGWDFRKPENSHCNHGINPVYIDTAIDDINHDPYELVFVKYKGDLPFDTIIKRRALIYKKWLDERPKPLVVNSTNITNKA
jgi:hypothetical protein